MKQNLVALAKTSGKALLTATLIGLVILLIGLLAKWTAAADFSNAFFITGSLVIIIGLSFVFGGNQIRGDVRIYYASGADVNQRVDRVMTDTLQAYRALIVFSMCGAFLIVAAMVIGSLF